MEVIIMHTVAVDQQTLDQLALKIKQWASELGFQKTGITDIDLTEADQHLSNWINNNYHGDME